MIWFALSRTARSRWTETLTLGCAACTAASCGMPRTAAKRYGTDVSTSLLEVSRRGLVGGQEDLIADVHLT